MLTRLAECLKVGVESLKQGGMENPTLDARLLLQKATGLSTEEIIAYPEKYMTQGEEAAYESLLARRLTNEPVAHILGKREFWGQVFAVSSDVLIPRPDSETLIEAVLEQCPEKDREYNILDLGVGSGCLLISLLLEYSKAQGVGVDKSASALEIAEQNARNLGVFERVSLIESDWCKKLNDTKFEIVVANPPYIPSNGVRALMPEVADFEPKYALDGGDDGLACYRVIAETLPPHLSPNAVVALEVGIDQHEQVADIFVEQGFDFVGEKRDLGGIVRVVILKRS